MRVLPNTIAVFWSSKGTKQQCHADFVPLPGETLVDAVARYRELFPDDTVNSVRDQSGRFQRFAA
jgi:hypothetical protein